MKILYHHRTLAKDGQNVHIEELTSALRRAGQDIVFVGPGGDGGGADGGNKAFQWFRSKIPAAAYEVLELLYSLVAYRRLRRAYLESGPQVLYERYNLYLLAGAWLKRRHGVPLLLEVNAPLVHERTLFGNLALQRLAAWAEGWVWRSADIVLPVTDELANFVRQAGVPDDRIRIIPNGINRELFPRDDGAAARKELGLEGKTILGFTGYLRSWHGLNRVVDLIAEHGEELNLHFLVIGDGPARAELIERAAHHGVAGRLTLLGLVGRDKIAHYVNAFDVALQPEVVPYASPLKLFEYMALGRAIVAPDRANIREVLEHGKDALLFDPDSQGAFEAAVLELCRDDLAREHLGAAAARKVDDRDMTWDGNARRVVALAQEVMSRLS